MDKAKIITALCLLAVVGLFLAFGPQFTIWSLNAVFGLDIPYTFKTWCAVAWLLTMLHGIKISVNRGG